MHGFVRLFDQYSGRCSRGIPNRNMGGCRLSRCEWLGGLFLSGKQEPSDSTDCVHSCSANLPHCDCRLALSRQPLFGSCCKCRHVCTGRFSRGNTAATTESRKIIQNGPLWLPLAFSVALLTLGLAQATGGRIAVFFHAARSAQDPQGAGNYSS